MIQIETPRLSDQLQAFLHRSRALSPTDLVTVIALADVDGIVFVRLEPKGVVLDDVLTGISGVLHASPDVILRAVETLLHCRETLFRLEILPLGIEQHVGFEVRFQTAEL